MYPKTRLDALTDGIFAVAMTLLILDVRLPEEFHAHNASELVEGLRALTPKFVPYALSFVVLGLRWLSSVQVRTRTEHFDSSYTIWWLFYLLLITCVPFTTMVVGRFVDLAPSIWLYAGNTALIGLVSFHLMARTPGLERDASLRDRQISLTILVMSSLLAIAAAFFDPRHALWAFGFNLMAPVAIHWWGGGFARSR